MSDRPVPARTNTSTAGGSGRQQETPRIGSWEWDRASNRVSWSAAVERLHGRDPGSFGGTFEDFASDIHPEDRERVLADVQAALESVSAPYRTSYRIVLPDGGIRWLEAFGEPLLDDRGEVAAMRGICMDVSAERKRARQRDAVYAANHALASATDLDEGLRALTRIVCEAFDCAYVEYRDSIDGGHTLRPRAAWWPPDQASDLELTREIEVTADESPAARAWTSGVPVWANDLNAEPASPRRDAALAVGLQGAFAVPVTGTDGVMGVLAAFTAAPLADRELPPTLDALSAEVSQFVRRLSAEGELRVREQQQAAVAELGRLALEWPSQQELLDAAVQLVSQTLHVEYAKVLQLLPDGEALRLVSGLGWQPGLVGQATVGSGLDSQAGFTLHSDRPVVVPDLRAEKRFSGPPLLHEHGVVSGLSTVIRGADGAWGVLGAHTQHRRSFSDDDTLFLESVANILASAIERDRRERAQAFLLRANDLLFASLDYEETLRQVAALAVTEVADWCVVYLLDEHGEREPLEIAHRDPGKVELVERYREQLAGGRPPRGNVVDRAIETGETQLVPRIAPEALSSVELSPGALKLLEQLEIRALAVAPLRTRERTLGAILLVSAESGYRYGAAERQMVEELARRGAIAIDNAQLYQQTREALRTREDFVSIASHELRSPLTSIIGYSARLRRLAQQDRLDSSAADNLEVIHGEAERMQQTLELFLDMAGLDTGRFTAEIEPAHLVELVKQATESLARRQSVEPDVRLPESEVTVETDPSRVQTILSNLLSNAVKYGGRPPRITVTLEQAGAGAVLRVRDNGDGIPEAEREHIFERFYRGSSAEGGSRRGLGLGLYISKQIADRIGARLTFETEEGIGTEFILELPEHPD